MVETQDRVAVAEHLFAAVGREGRVSLAVLSDDDECVLGGGQWALSDADVWRRWAAAPDEERAVATRRVVDSLRERGCVDAVEDRPEGPRLTLAPELGVVQVARARPAFVLTALPVPADRPLLAPLVYAVADEVAGLRGLVVELRGGGRHDYRLMTPRRAAEGLAAWAHRAVTTVDWGGRCDTVVLEVFRHRAGEPLEAAALTVPGPESAQDGMTLFFGGGRARHETQDASALADQVEELLLQSAEGTVV